MLCGNPPGIDAAEHGKRGEEVLRGREPRAVASWPRQHVCSADADQAIEALGPPIASAASSRSSKVAGLSSSAHGHAVIAGGQARELAAIARDAQALRERIREPHAPRFVRDVTRPLCRSVAALPRSCKHRAPRARSPAAAEKSIACSTCTPASSRMMRNQLRHANIASISGSARRRRRGAARKRNATAAAPSTRAQVPARCVPAWQREFATRDDGAHERFRLRRDCKAQSRREAPRPEDAADPGKGRAHMPQHARAQIGFASVRVDQRAIRSARHSMIVNPDANRLPA